MAFVIGLLLTVQALTCVFLILIILMQPSKADGGLGAAFGAGATDTLFGARTGNVLTKGTIWGATILFVTSVLLAVLIAHQKPTSIVLDKVATTPKAAEKAAATPASDKKPAPAKDAAAAKSAAPAEKAAEKPATTPAPAKK
ncbi:MAG: preprotein translocase subunit SecG [Verrucomicrobia bacterium]|nr:preprotein translocase subunit SecG [Verrucomicrobiota bacterium]